MLVYIKYTDPVGFAVLFTTIQSQTTAPIYVSGVGLEKHQIIKKYGLRITLTNNEETLPTTNDGLLVLHDNFIVSRTLITNIKRARQWHKGLIVPTTPRESHRSDRLDPNFKWYNSMCEKKDLVKQDWYLEGCYYYEKKKENPKRISTEYAYFFAD